MTLLVHLPSLQDSVHIDDVTQDAAAALGIANSESHFEFTSRNRMGHR